MSEGAVPSFFSLQQAEILSSVSPDYQSPQVAQLTRLADDIATIVSGLSPENVSMKCVESSFFQDLLPAPIPDSASIRFVPPTPSAFCPIGSVPLRTLCLSGASDDPLAIELTMLVPRAVFQQKDYLDYRYYVKRCAYLWHVKEQLVQHSYRCTWSTESASSVLFTGKDSLKPCLQISRPSTNATVYLIPVAEPDFFPMGKLNPSRRNVRDGSTDATPNYSQGIVQDMVLLSHMSIFKEAFERDCPALPQAVTLFKAWMLRRGVVGIDEFVVTALCVLWFKHGKLSAVASASQLLRNILDLVANMFGNSEGRASSLFSSGHKGRESWETFPSSTPLRAAFTPGSEIPQDMARHFKMLVMCPTMKLNMLWRTSLGALRAWSIEARIATRVIQAGDASVLTEHFLSPRASPLLRFDVHWKLFVDSSVRGWFLENWKKQAETALARVLGDRAHAVALTREFEGGIVVSAILQPDKAFRLVDMSPSPEEFPEKAEQFKAFWGKKLSQLRRFQDGQVREAVVWKPETAGKSERVPAHVLFTHVPTTILKAHVDPAPARVQVVADQFDKWVAIADGNAEDEFSDLWASYQQLTKILRQLNHDASEKELPLNVIAVYPLGQALRRTSVFVAKKGNMNRFPIWYPCVQVAIGLEGSGSWPKSLDAEKFTGSAFLLAIARVIQKKHSKVICTASLDCLDICLNGRIFRCSVICPSDGLIKRKSIHSTAIQGVVTRFRAMSGTCRLAERFMRSHFFSDSFMPPEIVELVVAFLFVQIPSSDGSANGQETSSQGRGGDYTPLSSFRGFVSFLDLLESFPWETQPLIVDVVNDLSKEDRMAIEEEFRREEHLLSVASCSPNNKRSLNHSLSKSDSESKHELKRLRIYAKVALDTLRQFPEAAPGHESNAILDSIFTSPVNIFDILVKLHHVACPIRSLLESCHTVTTKSLSNEYMVLYSNSSGVNFSKSLSKPLKNCRDIIVDEDFVSRFVDEMRKMFAEESSLVQMVFHDKYGCDVIGFKLKPKLADKQRDLLKSELSEIVETIALEGHGMVSKILVKKSVLDKFG